MTADDVKYEIILYWSKDDQAFIAEVPELPGCAADGATYQQAVANVERVIREWIETAIELGRPIPRRKGDCCMHELSTTESSPPGDSTNPRYESAPGCRGRCPRGCRAGQARGRCCPSRRASDRRG